MDFIKEFNAYIESLPLNEPMKKKIIEMTANFYTTSLQVPPEVAQARTNIYQMFSEKKGLKESFYLDYLTYILTALTKAKESK